METAPRFFLPLLLLAGLAGVVGVAATLYRPDPPADTIAPGSSPGPAFVVQVLRPRLGLPLGGLLPPELFGLEARLGFDATSPGATIGGVGPGRVELRAGDWDLLLVLDGEGRISRETRVIFPLLFEERLRRVRCRPGDPVAGRMRMTALPGTGELSGSFDIELPRCEDAATGAPLGWPPRPLMLHGSFDRLPMDTGAKRGGAGPVEGDGAE